jgi:hypothetical protein
MCGKAGGTEIQSSLHGGCVSVAHHGNRRTERTLESLTLDPSNGPEVFGLSLSEHRAGPLWLKKLPQAPPPWACLARRSVSQSGLPPSGDGLPPMPLSLGCPHRTFQRGVMHFLDHTTHWPAGTMPLFVPPGRAAERDIFSLLAKQMFLL